MASERVVKITDQGELRFYEAKENGRNYIALKGSADIVSSYEIALPAGQGVDGNVLTSDGTGGTRWGNSDATLNTAYHTGAQISADSGQIEILKTDDTNGIYIDKTAVGAGTCLRVDNAGTGQGVYVEQAGNAKALEVYQGNSNVCVEVNKADSGPGTALNVINLGTGIGALVTQSGNAIAAKIVQGGTANSLYVDHNDVGSSPSVRIDNAGTGAGLYVEQGGAGKGVHIVEANSENGLYVQKTDIGSGAAVAVANAGTGAGVSVSQTANGIALSVAKTTGAANCVSIDNDGTGCGVYVKQDGEWAGLLVDKTATGATVGAQVVSAGTAAALWARTSNAAGVALLADGNGTNSITAQFTHDGAGTGPVISIDNSGTGEDVTGTDSSWQIGSAGRALFSGTHTYGLSLRSKSRTISTGAFTIDGTYSTIYVAGESGNDDLDTISGAAYDGQVVVLAAGGISGDITVTRNGNIKIGATSRLLDDLCDRLTLQWYEAGPYWCELSFAANA